MKYLNFNLRDRCKNVNDDNESKLVIFVRDSDYVESELSESGLSLNCFHPFCICQLNGEFHYAA